MAPAVAVALMTGAFVVLGQHIGGGVFTFHPKTQRSLRYAHPNQLQMSEGSPSTAEVSRFQHLLGAYVPRGIMEVVEI